MTNLFLYLIHCLNVREHWYDCDIDWTKDNLTFREEYDIINQHTEELHNQFGDTLIIRRTIDALEYWQYFAPTGHYLYYLSKRLNSI